VKENNEADDYLDIPLRLAWLQPRRIDVR